MSYQCPKDIKETNQQTDGTATRDPDMTETNERIDGTATRDPDMTDMLQTRSNTGEKNQSTYLVTRFPTTIQTKKAMTSSQRTNLAVRIVTSLKR